MALSQIKAGGAVVEISADDSKLAKGLNAAKSKLTSWSSSLSAIGNVIAGAVAAGTAALAAIVGRTANVASQFQDLSDKTGISAKSISSLAFAAGQTGVDLSNLQMAMKSVAKWTGASDKEFAKFGINAKKFKSMSPEDQFKTFAEAVSRIKHPTDRAAAAIELFGKTGQDLLPLIEHGASGITALQREAERLGLTMSNEDAEAGEKFGDSLAVVGQQVAALGNKIGSILIPHLQPLIDKVIEMSAAFLHWIDETRPKIQEWISFFSEAAGRNLDTLKAIVSYLGEGEFLNAIKTAALNFTLYWVTAADKIAQAFKSLWNSDYFQGVIDGNASILSDLGINVDKMKNFGNAVGASSKSMTESLKKDFDTLVKNSQPGADLKKRGTDTPGRLALGAASATQSVVTDPAKLNFASVGTFSARAAGGLAGNTDTAAIRIATQATARNTQEIARGAAGGGLAAAFGA